MYSQEITRLHRTAFVVVIDRSASMQQQVRFGDLLISKAEAVAYTANALITELLDRSRRIDGVRDYYDVAVVGYGNEEVEMLLCEEGFISVARLAARVPQMRRIAVERIHSDGLPAIEEHHRLCWVEPRAEGTTPMYEALLRVRDMVLEWSEKECNRESFPPVVIHITDGEASDCDDEELRDVCSQIRRIATADGNALLFNIHISTDSTLPSIVFPMADELFSAGRYARLLAECSSVMPTAFDGAIAEIKGVGAVPPYFGMGYNASIVELLSIINIGSRSITNME